jgi:aspartyl-tRNA(Asn)/glutamyl-tRNA(Gln) amidotransferase subunit A
MYLADIFTVSANLTGAPAVSVPCGFTADRLPIGLQFTGRMFDEATILRVADAYERLTEWHTRAPAEEFKIQDTSHLQSRGEGRNDL